MTQRFETLALSYSRRYGWSCSYKAVLRWTPLGALAGIGTLVLASRLDVVPPWVSIPAFLLPLLVSGLSAWWSSRGVATALSWLDREVRGKQVLQSAWEFQRGASPYSELLEKAASALLSRFSRQKIPRTNALRSLLAVVSAALFVFLFAGGPGLIRYTDEEMEERGYQLESWAESWAEYSDGSGRPESRELAEKLGALGRRMADGSIGRRESARALSALEEELQERRNDLLRENLAESLVEDLNVDRETAEMFRVERRRIPPEVLSELGDAIRGDEVLPESDRDAIEDLLSNPDFRDRMGNGTPELLEELSEALADALDPEDPRIRELDEALNQTRRAKGDDSGEGSDPGDQGSDSESSRPAEKGESPGSGGERGSRTDPDDANEIRGGEGRGDAAVDDQRDEPEALYRSSLDDSLNLPSDSDRTGSWRTVIRAYSEGEPQDEAADYDVTALWQDELEAVISREEIPLRTRDYVRDYFLALEEEQ